VLNRDQEMPAVEVLIADQHEFFRRTLRSLIESHHNWHVCGEAADGIEAVEMTKRLGPRLVVMDFTMPRMDGFRAAQEIRRELPETKIVLIGNSPEIAEAGADDVFTKEAITRDVPKYIAALTRASESGNAREYGLDRTLEETFPCSDALSSIPNPDLALAS